MYDGIERKEALGLAFDKAYEVLKETDGILPLPKDGRDVAQIKTVAPLERANNVFWIVVFVCGLCGRELGSDKVGAYALRSYNLDGCHLENARLMKSDLRRADLAGAHFSKRSDLDLALLEGASLEGAIFDEDEEGSPGHEADAPD